jgi:hypothetical protein
MYRFTDDHSSHTCLLFRLSWSPSFCRIRELRQDQTSSARGAEVLVGTRLTHTKGDPALFRSPAHHTLADLSRVLTSTAGEHQGVDASMAAATTAMHAWSRFADPGHADPDHRAGLGGQLVRRCRGDHASRSRMMTSSTAWPSPPADRLAALLPVLSVSAGSGGLAMRKCCAEGFRTLRRGARSQLARSR